MSKFKANHQINYNGKTFGSRIRKDMVVTCKCGMVLGEFHSVLAQNDMMINHLKDRHS